MIEELDSRHLEDSCSQDDRSRQYSSVQAWKPQKPDGSAPVKEQRPKSLLTPPTGADPELRIEGPTVGMCRDRRTLSPQLWGSIPSGSGFSPEDSGMPFLLSPPSHMWGFSANAFTDTLECHTPPAMQPRLYLGRSILKLTTAASYLETEGSPWYWSSWMMQARSFRRNSPQWM